jgi:Phosphotransferase enzyme family
MRFALSDVVHHQGYDPIARKKRLHGLGQHGTPLNEGGSVADSPGHFVPALLGIRLEPEGQGRYYTAYPNLRGVRWLLPTDRPVLRRAGIRGLYQPASPRGLVLKRLVDGGVLRGEKVWLEEGALAALEAAVAEALGEVEVRLAFYVGVPSPQQKVTAQVLSPAGKTLAYAKIATSSLARAAIEAEWRTLVRLSGSLRGRVPEVLDWFSWQDSRVLLTTSGPERAGPRRLSGAHSSFCEGLFLSSAEELVFGGSPMWTRMVETLPRLNAEDLPGTLAALYEGALRRLGEELGPVSLPLSLAHRDFAPWNTRLGPEGLFVFDWERARQGVTPLYDMFHFRAIQAALFQRRKYRPDLRSLEPLLRRLWPGGHGHLPSLYLAYLVDMSLVYSEAQVAAPGVGERRVWRWFVEQIETYLEAGPPL